MSSETLDRPRLKIELIVQKPAPVVLATTIQHCVEQDKDSYLLASNDMFKHTTFEGKNYVLAACMKDRWSYYSGCFQSYP